MTTADPGIGDEGRATIARPDPDLARSDTGVPRPVLVTLLLASMLTIMAGATISPSLPGMREHFSGVANASLLVRLVLTVTALAIAVTAPVVGLVVDRFGRKPVLAVSTAVYAAAGATGLVLDDLVAILAGRALLGIAVAGVMTSATALLADLHTGPARSRALGLQAASMGAGGVVFLAVGGLLAEVDWRGPFAVYLAALPLTVLVLRHISEPRRHPPGEIVQMPADRPHRARVARPVWGILALAFLAQVVFCTIPTQLPFYLADLSGAGAAGSGLCIASMVAVSAVVGLNYGKLSARLGYRQVAATSFGFLAVGMATLGLAPGWGVVLVGLTAAGVGVGLVMPNLNAWLTSTTSPVARGRALGAMVSLLFLGQFMSPVLSQPVLAAAGIDAAYLTAAATAGLAALTLTARDRLPGTRGAGRLRPSGASRPKGPPTPR